MAERRVAHVAGAGGVAGAVLRTAMGRDLVGRRYVAPFAALEVAASVDHRVVAWDDVSVDEGTGVVHIAPGCGTEDFALAAAEQLPVLAPLEEDGRYTAGYGWLSGRHVDEVESGIVDALDASAMLFGHDRVTHRYPMCWRCNTPLVHRVVDEWFLACDEVREPMRRAARTVRWQPAAAGRRMDDWLKNMGDWCISRKRYWGLPLPFYKCPSGHLTVVGSKDELVERALDPTGAADLPELHRPWIDGVRIRCEACGAEAQRVTEVGDCWLDAGIVAFSTLGWTADDQAEWERWFPAEVVCEMSEQIRLWFYALLFMSVVLDGRAPYRQALVHSHVTDERGEEMHKSKGNAIWFDEAVERTGADSMRWLFASQPPDRDLRFGNAALEEVNRKFLTFWNTYAFFVTYANVDGFRPRPELRSEGPVPDGLDDLDRWALARLAELVDRSRRAYDDLEAVAVTAAFDRFADDLSNWYVRRSRARFWRGVHAGDSDKQAAYETLWFCLVTALRVVAPVMPFVADHMWTNLVAGTPRSVHLDEYPDLGERWRDDELLTAMAEVRAVAELGRVVRTNAGIRRRQPLRVLYAVCADASARRAVAGHSRLVADECNVAEVSVVDQADDFATTELVPDYARLGPRFRDDVPAIARLIAAGDVVRVDGGYRVGRWDLDEADVVVRRRARPGYAVAEGRGWVVAVDVTVTPDLELEGRARDLVRALQVRRKDLDLDVTTPVQVTYPPDVADVVAVHGAWIAEQTLAASLEPGDALNLRQ
jgi:isoleucyl-tRNA synthetase